MIDLYTSPTPNGWKAAMALEQLALDYTVKYIDLAVGDQHRVIVLALALEYLEMIEASRGRFEVPFSDDRRLVTSGLEQLGYGLLGAIEASLVGPLTVEV